MKPVVSFGERLERNWGRCARCGEEIYLGEGYYALVGRSFCRECLPRMAEVLLCGYFRVAGEEVEST